MKRRKHRLVVEFTAERPCTEKDARWYLHELLSEQRPAHLMLKNITKVQVKQFSRVLQGHKMNDDRADRARLKEIDRIAGRKIDSSNYE